MKSKANGMYTGGSNSGQDQDRLRDRLQLALFTFVLLLPSLGYLLGANDFELLAENRRLTEAPSWPKDAEQLKAFPRAFERHFDDHFGFRSYLVGRDKRLEWLGRRTEVEIQIGEGGWLFQGNRRTAASMFCISPSRDVLESWIAAGRARQRHFASRGTAFYWVMAPNKHSIYPEELPAFARAELTPCHVGRLEATLSDHGIPFLDLRAALHDVRAERPLYHRTDTHWNELGAAHAVAVLVDEIRQRFPEVPRFSLDDYQVVVEEEAFEGNLASRLSVYGEQYDEPFVRLERRRPATARPAPSQAPIDLRAHARKDPKVRFTTGRTELPTAWIYHDSFGFATMKLLAEHFESVRFINSSGWIDEFPTGEALPDIVISLFVENHLQEAARAEPALGSDHELAHSR